VLAGGAAGLLLAACTDTPAPAPAPTTPPPPDPLLAELAAERTLLAAYDAAIARHPGLRPRLAGPRADHAEHVTALARYAGEPTPTPTPSISSPAVTSPAPAVPGTPAAALAGLRAAERAAASARGTAALTATPARAALLAGISASEASHLVVLA
jgi:hypothetical protein